VACGAEVAAGRARGASVQAPARGTAHGWLLHVWRVEVGRQVAAVGGDGTRRRA
jgi:hypothetical protein